MNRKRWIIGLSIASVIAISGTAFALSSESQVNQSAGQTLGSSPNITTTEYRVTTTENIPNNNVNPAFPRN